MKNLYFFITALFISTPFLAQDNCGAAIPVSLDMEITVGEINGDMLDAPICASGGDDGVTASEWYTYTSEDAALLTISTDLPQNEGIDTRFHVYTEDCNNLSCLGGDDDSGSGYLSISDIFIPSGQTINIVFDNRWSTSGFDFIITETPMSDDPIFYGGPNGISGGARCVVDMNGDFLDDIVGTNDEGIIIQYQQADGSFIEEQKNIQNVAYSPSWSIAAGDIDGNGYNDLVFGNGVGVSFIHASDDGESYTETHTDEYVFCQRTNFSDINNDGHLDAFVCHDVEPNVFYLNDGNGNLLFNQGGMGDVAGGGNYGSVWVDFNNDGRSDLFIAKCRGGNNPANINEMHIRTGDDTYLEVAQEIGLRDSVQTWSSAWADYDNDGDMDGYIGASSDEHGPHRFMLNDGEGNFENYAIETGVDIYPSYGIENAPYDFNNDGYVDIITNNGNMLVNNGDLSFDIVETPFGRGTVGDLNNDGFLDVLGNGTVFYNVGNNNNFIKINTVGTISNLNGIGARVTLESPMGTQIRDVRSGESFSVMSSLTTHFGIGTDEEITSITIQWPSGQIDVINNPVINTTITVTEGAVTGIEDLDATSIRFHPNPTKDFINIESTLIQDGDIIRIYDYTGKLVMEQSVLDNTLNISKLASGSYYMVVSVGTQDLKVQVIKE